MSVLRFRSTGRFLISIVTVIALVLPFASSIDAYKLNGGHFSTNCYLKYSYRLITNSTYRTAFLTGLQSWSSYSGSTTCWQETTSSDWKVGMYLENNNSVPWDGYADILPSKTYVPTSFVYTHFNQFYMDGYSAAKKKSVTSHEIGHALGIAHPATDGAQVMNSVTCGSTGRWCHYSINAPQTDDKNAINAIY